MVVRVSVNNRVGDAGSNSGLFAKPGDASTYLECANDCRAERRGSLYRSTSDDIGDQAPVTVSQVSQRDERLLTGEYAVLLNCIAGGKDIEVAGALLIVDPEAAGFANF